MTSEKHEKIFPADRPLLCPCDSCARNDDSDCIDPLYGETFVGTDGNRYVYVECFELDEKSLKPPADVAGQKGLFE